MIIISRGAEAIIYEEDGLIVKERLSKSYRIPEIDRKLIQSRIKREAKVLAKLNEADVKTPKFVKINGNKLYMEKIDGKPVKQILTEENQKDILKKVGLLVSCIHNLDIVHGDLTTLNFMESDGEVYVLDFGLSSFSHKDEDKAVDLYVFERAVKCAHSENFLDSFYQGYSIDGKESVLKRLEQVRLRGRKREEMFG